MATANTDKNIDYLSTEIDRCNKLLIGTLSSSERLALMDYQRALHGQLLHP
jgi:hypothetical protein